MPGADKGPSASSAPCGAPRRQRRLGRSRAAGSALERLVALEPSSRARKSRSRALVAAERRRAATRVQLRGGAPKAAREAYSLYVERAAEGANEAAGPLSARRRGDADDAVEGGLRDVERARRGRARCRRDRRARWRRWSPAGRRDPEDLADVKPAADEDAAVGSDRHVGAMVVPGGQSGDEAELAVGREPEHFPDGAQEDEIVARRRHADEPPQGLPARAGRPRCGKIGASRSARRGSGRSSWRSRRKTTGPR